MIRPSLRREARDLALVAAGAIPGALLRWQAETLGLAIDGGFKGVVAADFAANLLGCLLIGLLMAQPPARTRLVLWGGIGFCGSLTTFSSWMLQLVRTLDQGQPLAALAVLLASLGGGLLLVNLGQAIGTRHRLRGPKPRSRVLK